MNGEWFMDELRKKRAVATVLKNKFGGDISISIKKEN